MKKIFLLMAVFAASFTTASAQQNYVVNGNFEDASNLVFDTFDTDQGLIRVKEIPGWDKNTGDKNATDCTNGWDGLNKWNVYANIRTQEPDGDKIKEGNTHYLHLQRYDYNGWATGELKQTITGLTIGHQYRLNLLYRFNVGDFNGDTPAAGYTLVKYENGKEGSKIKYEDALEATTDWAAVEETFTAKADGVVIKVFLTNPWRSQQWNQNVWADFDEVSIVDIDPSGIDDVNVDKKDSKVYYNLGGIKMSKPEMGGLYIHNGKKVAIK